MKVIVSACLAGDNCKYNGGNNLNQKMMDFLKTHEMIKICPEVLGGLFFCENMEGINIELLVARVKEKYPEEKARIIHDNGKQFISKDFKSLISLLELYETAARVCHPQSNGKLERFHSTLKTEHVRQTAYFSYEDAKEKMAQWIDFYNNERLHGALLYLTPADYFEGRKESRLAERREKLHTTEMPANLPRRRANSCRFYFSTKPMHSFQSERKIHPATAPRAKTPFRTSSSKNSKT